MECELLVSKEFAQAQCVEIWDIAIYGNRLQAGGVKIAQLVGQPIIPL